MKPFSGVGVAIVTPFKRGEIDFAALEKIVNHLIDGGVSYIVSLGTTGETTTLSATEQKQVVQQTIQFVNNKLPVVVGCGGNNSLQVANNMQEMEQWGNFDAFLSVSPAYNKPSQEGIFQHFSSLAKATTKDIILYNVPGRTAKNMSVETILRLANSFENIVGVKEAGGNMHQSTLLAMQAPANFSVLSGDDDLYLPQLSVGFHGIISVVANAYPNEWVSIVKNVHANALPAAKLVYQQLYDFVQLIFEENNPAGIKCAMNELGLCENEFRLPIVPVNQELEQKIRSFVNEFS